MYENDQFLLCSHNKHVKVHAELKLRSAAEKTGKN